MSTKIKFILIAILTSFAFWIPVFSLFMQSKDISENEVFLLLTIYSFSVVLLEYPTGVFGDLFSHKTSVIIGFVLTAIANMGVSFLAGFPFMLGFVIISALALTFISGSDAALRYSALKENFKRDYPTIKIAGTIATLVGITLGPVLFQVNTVLPFLINGVCFFIAFLVVLTIPSEKKLTEGSLGNAFSLAFAGTQNVAKSANLQALLVASATVGTLAINMKWIYPTLFTKTAIPVEYWGVLITSLYLARMIGTFLYKKFKNTKVKESHLLMLLIGVIFLLGYSRSIQMLYPLLFIQLTLVGLLETSFDIDIQHETEDRVRASVLSLSSLTERLFSGLHIAILGVVAQSSTFIPFALITSGMLLLTLLYFSWRRVSVKT